MCDVDVNDTVTLATTSIPTSVSDPVMSTSKGDPASNNSTLADALSRLVLKREKPHLLTFSGRETTKSLHQSIYGSHECLLCFPMLLW